MAEQLLDFIFSDPVVLICVQHWDQDVQMGEQLLQSDILGKFNVEVRSLTPLGKFLVKGVTIRNDVIPERFEKTAQELFTAPTRKNG